MKNLKMLININYFIFFRREQIAQSLNLSQPSTDSAELSNVNVGEVDNKQQQQLKVRGKKCLPYFP